jgi:outer membrane protein OmpU
MKRVLLTTTALVMTAGIAAADVTFSGEIGVALVDDNGAAAAAALTQNVGGVNAAGTAFEAAETDAAFATRQATARAANADMYVASHYDLNVSLSAGSDNGVTVAAGFDMGSGEKIDYNDDDVLEVQGEAIGNADVAVSYAGWTLTVDQNGIDNLFDDTQQEDLSIAGSVGSISVAYAMDMENDTSSYSLGYSAGDLTLGFTGTNNDDAGGDATGLSASYAMGDLTLSASMSDESVDGEDDVSLGFSYAMGAMTVGYTTIRPGANADYGDEWDASVAYSAGALSASFAIDETDATTMIAEYDLGGATAFAAMHDKAGDDNDLTTFGINFAF